MNGLGEIIAANAIKRGNRAFSYTVHVEVKPQPEGMIEDILRDEIASNLESLPYVMAVVVRQKP